MASENELLTLSSTLIKLMPVVIGGGLTIIGGFFGSFLTHHLSKKTKREDFYRENIEKSAKLALGINHWVDDYKNINLFDGEKEIGQSPVDELEIIVKFYLPELKVEMFNIKKSEREYKKWVLLTKQAKKPSQLLGDDFIKEYKDIYRTLSTHTNDFVNKAASLLK